MELFVISINCKLVGTIIYVKISSRYQCKLKLLISKTTSNQQLYRLLLGHFLEQLTYTPYVI